MDKVLVILPDDNKGKYIAKGYSNAFKDLSYFVIEKKIYDLNIDEIKKISPHLIFCYWSSSMNKVELTNFLHNISEGSKIIYLAETKEEIPEELIKKENSFTYYFEGGKAKNKLLPAINIKDYKTKFKQYKYGITFAGNPACIEREKILSDLIMKYGNINIFCRSYDFYKSADEIESLKLLTGRFLDLYRASYRGYVETTKELAQIYISSKINLDLPSPNKLEMNYRCLEITASGGFLIAPKHKNIEKRFELGKEIEIYNNSVDLNDKIEFYLRNLNIAQLISAKGRKNTASNYSYIDRVKKIIKEIYGKDISN